MQQGDGNNLRAHQLEWAIDDVEVHARDGALRGSVIEDVREGAAKHAKRFFRAVHRERRFLTDVEGANVVEAEDVVGVGVGEQNGVEAIEANTQCLLAKVGRGVDHYVFSVAREQQGRTQPIVVGVLRGADAAMASERGHAHGGAAGAEHGDFYRSGRHNLTRLYRGGADCGAENVRGASSLWPARRLGRPRPG